MSTIIGIDLGTTHSVVSHLGENGPAIIPNALGEALTPSVVGIDSDDKLHIGRAAKEFQVVHPDRCAALFKRHMGSDWTTQIGDQEYSPEELSSLVLRQLKEDAEAHLKESITRAVITVPAYFNDQQRKATINAGRIAGLKVERIINEPTAAALAYGFHEAEEEKTLLVFDLGGGTFDVSIVEQFSGVLEVKSSAGETFLGGEDFTRAMASRILSEQGKNFERAEMEAPLMVSRLVQQCELAKCRLTDAETTTVRLPNKEGDLGESPQEVPVSREQFEKWTHHILGRVELPVRRVLGDGKLERSDIHEIILVGGATRMPAVHDLVQRMFDQPPLTRINPDEAVAMGAAVQAGLIGQDQSVEDLVVTDVAPFTLGIETTKLFGQERRDGYFLPIIHRNTTIPVSRVETISTLYPNQTEVLIKIYQGENRRIDNNLYLGQFSVNGIPLGPAGQQVDVRFTYDLNGVLEVEATVARTGKKFSHVVTQFARGMSDDQIRNAVGRMDNLKTHPRDESENRLLLRKAERVYKELSHEMREELGILLDGFETALAMRDPETIERHREALEAFLDRYESGFDPPKPWNPNEVDEDDDEF